MYEYNATVVRIVDGDTAIFDVDCGFNTHFIEKFRFARINAPELSTKEGVVASVYLTSILPVGSKVVIHSSKRDTSIKEEKYGRWLAEVEFGGRNINSVMLNTGHAVLWK